MFLLFSATCVVAGQWGGGGVAKHTSFTPLRLSAESSSRPLTPSPLKEGGGGVLLPSFASPTAKDPLRLPLK